MRSADRSWNLSVGDSSIGDATAISQGSRGCPSTPHDHGAGRSRGDVRRGRLLPTRRRSDDGRCRVPSSARPPATGNWARNRRAPPRRPSRSLPSGCPTTRAGLSRAGVRGGRSECGDHGWRRIPGWSVAVSARRAGRPAPPLLRGRTHGARTISTVCARATRGSVIGTRSERLRGGSPRWSRIAQSTRLKFTTAARNHPAAAGPPRRLRRAGRTAAVPPWPERPRAESRPEYCFSRRMPTPERRRERRFSHPAYQSPLKPTPALWRKWRLQMVGVGLLPGNTPISAQPTAVPEIQATQGSTASARCRHQCVIGACTQRAAACRHRRIDLLFAGQRLPPLAQCSYRLGVCVSRLTAAAG